MPKIKKSDPARERRESTAAKDAVDLLPPPASVTATNCPFYVLSLGLG